MMTIEQHLLLKLSEECAEIIQAASKQSQFGPADRTPSTTESNAERLRSEINDVLTIVNMLECNGFIRRNNEQELERHMEEKIAKVINYRWYSARLKRVE